MQFMNKQELVTRQIAGETVIIPIRGGVGDFNSIYTLNPSGTFIWRLISEGTRLPGIVDAVCNEYEVTREAAEKDVAEFLESLKAEDLIQSAQDSGGQECKA